MQGYKMLIQSLQLSRSFLVYSPGISLNLHCHRLQHAGTSDVIYLKVSTFHKKKRYGRVLNFISELTELKCNWTKSKQKKIQTYKIFHIRLLWHTHSLKLTQLKGMELAARTTFFVVFVILSFAHRAPISGAATLNVGVILNLQSLVGKMARTSILMAMEDFYAVHRNYKTKLVLHIRDSNADNVQAASEGNFWVICNCQ